MHSIFRCEKRNGSPAIKGTGALSGGHTPVSSLHWLRSTTPIQGTCCGDQLNSLRQGYSQKKVAIIAKSAANSRHINAPLMRWAMVHRNMPSP